MLLVEGSSGIRFFRHLSTLVFRFRNFGNTKAVRVTFSIKNVQNLIYILKIQTKTEKTFFVSEKIASELVSLNCPYNEKDPFHR